MIKSLNVGDKLITHYEYDRDKNLTRQWTKMQGEVKEEKRIRLGIPKKNADNMTLLTDYHYSYDGNGNRVSKESLTGKTGYQYDTLNRLVKVQYPKSLEEYTYDKADNRIRRLTEKEEEIYKYDVCNRLVEKQTRKFENVTSGKAGTFGSTGNGIYSETDKTSGNSISLRNIGTAVPQGVGQIGEKRKQSSTTNVTVTKPNNLVTIKTSIFQYDNQGNLLREERKIGENRQESIYTYDGFNRQKNIVNFESKVQVNHYDGEGLRHEMEENGNLVKFLYADHEVVAEEKEDGNIIRFIRGYDLVASDSESARTYYHYACDEQGSITHILDEDENGEYSLKNYYEYGAFGDFREKEEEVENRFGYNGEVFDPIGEQYYLRARYYNPVIGRFTQEDTYYSDGLNLYAYCRNLPIGYSDPSGHWRTICEQKYNRLKGEHEGIDVDSLDTKARKQYEKEEAQMRRYEKAKAKREEKAAKKGAGKSGNSSNGKSDYKEYDIVPYDNSKYRTPGFEKHHGVLNEWAEHHIPGYTKKNAPTILLSKEKHALTKTVYQEWLRENYGKPVGISPDWSNMSKAEAMKLTNDMFDAANVPQNVRMEYFELFDIFITGG